MHPTALNIPSSILGLALWFVVASDGGLIQAIGYFSRRKGKRYRCRIHKATFNLALKRCVTSEVLRPTQFNSIISTVRPTRMAKHLGLSSSSCMAGEREGIIKNRFIRALALLRIMARHLDVVWNLNGDILSLSFPLSYLHTSADGMKYNGVKRSNRFLTT